MDELEARIEELRTEEELDAIRPELDGTQVMEHLGVSPGPDVGEALDFLLELRLDEGPLGEEEATRRLDAWWEARAEAVASAPRSRQARGAAGEAVVGCQSSGQTGAGSPAAKASTIRWASSSWYCTGGDFMK